MRVIVSLLSLMLLVGCARPTSLVAELAPRSLKAVNLEETLSRRDELMMAYSMTSYDAKNKSVSVVNGGWGVVTVQKGQQLDLSAAGPDKALPISLELPKNGRIVASLVLIEVDDYNRAKQMLDRVRQVHNIVAGPAAFLITAAEVLTPLKYVAAGLAASGIGLKLVDQFDDDDLLGQSSVDLYEAELRKKKQQLVHVPTVFTGQNLRDAFDYRLDYDITLKSVKIRPVRQ
ncbi:putative manganese transporter [Spirosoma sp. RP8]|uniref:Manganese transporter n=1 Tax=Spirosoma liriopis TaxID=2937440 RepID=A0ABT0HPX6_9BACT|nr:putative manganese transporter [Spirosoma liriopis]MCK8494221.1 putative manganese transporter [Spirosoma liriopis]